MPLVRLALPPPEFPIEMLDREIGRVIRAHHPVVHLHLGRDKLSLEGVERLLNDQGLAQAFNGELQGQGAHLVVDLRNCVFADPYGLAVLRALCAAVAPQVERMWLCLPVELQVQTYFGIVGLCDAVRHEVTLVGERWPGVRPSRNEVLLPVSCIANEADAAKVSRDVKQRLEPMLVRLGWPKRAAERTISAIREVTMNVVEHAECEGYVCVQGYRLKMPDGFLVAAISDAGVGMRATLERRHVSLRSSAVTDGEVLSRLFRDGLSSRDEAACGSGVRVLSDAVQTVGGRLVVRSGYGHYASSLRSESKHTRRVLIPGTHIRLELKRLGA